MTSRLTFSDARGYHEYQLDGRKVPSVTSIIGKALAKPALINAAAKETALWAAVNTGLLDDVLEKDAWIREATAAPRTVWNKRADDGRRLHTLAESLVYGKPMAEEIDGAPVADHVRDMAEQLARFFDAFSVEPVSHEAMCFHDSYRYAGRWDLVARIGETTWILDYKTGESGIWPETSLQLTAYGYATHYVRGEGEKAEDRPVSELDIERAGAVWVRPDSWSLVPVRFDRPVHGVFLHMGAVAAWAGMNRGQSVYAPVIA